MTHKALPAGLDVDWAMVDATTEEDIRRHKIEDGEDPDAAPRPGRLVTPAARVRRQLGLTEQALADLIGVPVATLRDWEEGRVQPDPAARALLRVLERIHPDRV